MVEWFERLPPKAALKAEAQPAPMGMPPPEGDIQVGVPVVSRAKREASVAKAMGQAVEVLKQKGIRPPGEEAGASTGPFTFSQWRDGEASTTSSGTTDQKWYQMRDDPNWGVLRVQEAAQPGAVAGGAAASPSAPPLPAKPPPPMPPRTAAIVGKPPPPRSAQQASTQEQYVVCEGRRDADLSEWWRWRKRKRRWKRSDTLGPVDRWTIPTGGRAASGSGTRWPTSSGSRGTLAYGLCRRRMVATRKGICSLYHRS